MSSWSGGFVRKFDPNGQDQGIFATDNLNGPTNIWFDDNGDLIVLNWSGGNAVRFNSEGVYQGVFISGLSNPEGISILPDGQMLIGNGGTREVKLFDSGGGFLQNIVESGSQDLLFPNAVIIKEKLISSTIETSVEEILVYPSLGTRFYVKSEYYDQIAYAKIFNNLGTLVDQIQVVGGELWDATQAPSGMYYLSAKLKNGKVIQQRIIVP